MLIFIRVSAHIRLPRVEHFGERALHAIEERRQRRRFADAGLEQRRERARGRAQRAIEESGVEREPLVGKIEDDRHAEEAIVRGAIRWRFVRERDVRECDLGAERLTNAKRDHDERELDPVAAVDEPGTAVTYEGRTIAFLHELEPNALGGDAVVIGDATERITERGTRTQCVIHRAEAADRDALRGRNAERFVVELRGGVVEQGIGDRARDDRIGADDVAVETLFLQRALDRRDYLLGDSGLTCDDRRSGHRRPRSYISLGEVEHVRAQIGMRELREVAAGDHRGIAAAIACDEDLRA